MTARKTLTAALGTLALLGATAGAADAATRHHHRGHTRMHAMNHGSSARGGRTSQDNMADQLNAQSLQQTRGGAMPAGSGSMDAPGAMPQ